MKTIKIIGLGSSNIDHMPLGIYKKLKNSPEVYTRTLDHPAIEMLQSLGVAFKSFDSVYESHDTFERTYDSIVNALLEEAKHKDIIYTVPGHPLFYETTTELLLNYQDDFNIEIVGGQSFIDSVITAINVPINTDFQVIDASTMHLNQLDYNKHTIITQVYDSMTLSDAKVTLLEYYPPHIMVKLVDHAGSENERVIECELHMIDHEPMNSNMLALYIPVVQMEETRNRDIHYMHQVFNTLVSDTNGCPWDKVQTHESLERYLIEETYELIEAIEHQDDEAIIEELGDILLQVALHSAIAEKDGYFNFFDVLESLNRKVVHRHPHVFGDSVVENFDDLNRVWNEAKAKEGKEQKTLKLEKDYGKIMLEMMHESIHHHTPLLEILKQRGEHK